MGSASEINQNNPLVRHPGEGRDPAKKIFCEAGKTPILSRVRGNLSFNWIPVFAGMT
jgi:hypothetical protein